MVDGAGLGVYLLTETLVRTEKLGYLSNGVQEAVLSLQLLILEGGVVETYSLLRLLICTISTRCYR